MSSSLLEQAIIDADELKEAALKNAESVILEKYAVEVKEAVDSLLEQEDDEMPGLEGEDDSDIVDDIPLAATEGEDLCPCPDDEEEVELDLDQIASLAGMEAGEAEESEEMLDMALSEDDDVEVEEEDLLEALGEILSEESKPDFLDLDKDGDKEESMKKAAKDKKEKEDDEVVKEEDEIDLTEEELAEILEELVVDMEPVPHGKNFHARPTESEAEYDLDISLAKEQDTAVAEELEELRKAVEKLEEQNKTLKLQKNKLVEDYKSLKGVAQEAATKLDEVNFANAKLIYTNRTLKSDSLNERQKTKLVEAISKVDSVEEAKIVFETLSNNISARKETGPKNLSEAVSKNSGLILKSNNENKPANANQVDRLKRLAGII
mgnify:CR=1 FL=1|jgi:hypothetical protein